VITTASHYFQTLAQHKHLSQGIGRAGWLVLFFCHNNSLAACEAKPTTLKRPSPGEGLRITCFVPTIVEAQNSTLAFRQCTSHSSIY
jgi:hypothetical protein